MSAPIPKVSLSHPVSSSCFTMSDNRQDAEDELDDALGVSPAPTATS